MILRDPRSRAEVGEEGWGDVGYAARRREAEADGEDVGVVCVEGAVVALPVEVSVDLAEGVARGRREDDVPGAGRPYAAPEPLQGVGVVAVSQRVSGDFQDQYPVISYQLPEAAGWVRRSVSWPEPQLAPQPADHDPPGVFVRREIHAAAADQVLDHPLPIHPLAEVEQRRAAIRHR